MTGYQEIYTDPSYAGQVIINTTAHIGNYGVMQEKQRRNRTRSKSPGWYVTNLPAFTPVKRLMVHYKTTWLNAGIVGISGIDTRALVRHIRTKGVMNCLISSEIFDEAVFKGCFR